MLGRIVRFSGFIYSYSKYMRPYMLVNGDSCGCTWHPFVGIGDENSLGTEGDTNHVVQRSDSVIVLAYLRSCCE
jgi:hypothetical protein